MQHVLAPVFMTIPSVMMGVALFNIYEKQYNCAVDFKEDYHRPSMFNGVTSIVIIALIISLFGVATWNNNTLSWLEWGVIVAMVGVSISFAAFDAKYQIIPNVSLLLFSTFAITLTIFLMLNNPPATAMIAMNAVFGGAIGYIFPSGINSFVKKSERIGQGDIKMFAAMGIITGWKGIACLMLAAWCLQLLTFYLFVDKAERHAVSMPLAPFAVLSLFVGAALYSVAVRFYIAL